MEQNRYKTVAKRSFYWPLLHAEILDLLTNAK